MLELTEAAMLEARLEQASILKKVSTSRPFRAAFMFVRRQS